MVTGFRREVAGRDLAAIHTAYAAHLTGGRGRAAVAAQPPGGPISGLLTETTFTTPSVRIEYVNADGGAKWRRYFWEDGPESGETAFESSSPATRPVAPTGNRGTWASSLPSWRGARTPAG